MRYTNVFCGRFSLATGTRFIAWFYIVLYSINIVLNILAVNIVKTYKENVDKDIQYDRDHLLTFNYICLTFGVVTILLSTAFLVKWSESEDFMNFLVKWNVVRCFFVFGAIIYVIVDMSHILSVSVSITILTIDLCASTYFTGVMASYIKELDDPDGQIHSKQQNSGREPNVYLVSHKTSLHTQHKVSYVNEVASSSSRTATDGFVDIPLNEEKKHREENDVPATQPQRIQSQESESKESNDKTASNSLHTLTNSITTNANNSNKKSKERENDDDIGSSGMECVLTEHEEATNKKSDEAKAVREINEVKETDDSTVHSQTSNEVSSDDKGTEKLAVVSKEAPRVVVIPASPEVDENFEIKKVEGKDNPAFEAVEARESNDVQS